MIYIIKFKLNGKKYRYETRNAEKWEQLKKRLKKDIYAIGWGL